MALSSAFFKNYPGFGFGWLVVRGFFLFVGFHFLIWFLFGFCLYTKFLEMGCIELKDKGKFIIKIAVQSLAGTARKKNYCCHLLHPT